MSTFFNMGSCVFLWIAMYKENHNDQSGAIIMMIWALWSVLTAIYFKMDEK